MMLAKLIGTAEWYVSQQALQLEDLSDQYEPDDDEAEPEAAELPWWYGEADSDPNDDEDGHDDDDEVDDDDGNSG
jgi:hypothetical protein